MNRLSIDRSLIDRFFHWFPPSVVFLLSLALTLMGWYFASQHVAEQSRLRFAREAARLQDAIDDRLSVYENSLYGARSFLATRGTVSRREWRSYVDGLNLQQRYPGVQGIGFSLRVSPKEKQAHIARIRAEGFPDYSIHPDGERAEYHTIVYLEPFTDRNLRAFGYDMFSEPVRRAAMERARDTGMPAVSGKVTLVQETGDDRQAGFLMYLPLYRGGRAYATAEERRTALLGFVYSPFRMNDLMNGVLGRERPVTFRLQVFEGNQAVSSALMYDSEAGRSEADARPTFTRERSIAPGGRPWTLRFTTLPAFDATNRGHESELVLLAGLAISALLFLMMRSFANTRMRAIALAGSMTHELRESREQFRAVAETANDAIISADERGRIIYFNRAAERMFGYSEQEAMGQPVTLLMPERFEASHRHGFQRFIATGEPRVIGKTLELVGKNKTGKEFPVEISVASWSSAGAKFFTAMLRDITARKAAEGELRKLNEALESRVQERTMALVKAVENLEQAHEFRSKVMESAVFGLGALDEQGRFTLVNRQFADMLGYTIDELIGKPYSVLLSRENQAALAPVFARVIGGAHAVSDAEIDMIRKDGTTTTVVFSWSPMLVKEKVVGVVGTVLDISARKRAEEEVRVLNAELERRVVERTAQLEAANKELEAFSYSVSHDLRAPLRHIDGYVQMLLEDVPALLADKDKRRLRKVADAAVQMGRLIDDLLLFSRMARQTMRQVRVDMNDLVREAIAETTGEAEGRRIDWRIDPLPDVLGDPAMLKQVWVNLLSNAVKYTQHRELAQIDIVCQTRESELCFSVRDNGAGFDMRYVDKLFGVFQRLHRAEEFEGTGIGLANVRRIVQRHGGKTWAEGQIDEGATFYFALPRAAAIETGASAAQPASAA